MKGKERKWGRRTVSKGEGERIHVGPQTLTGTQIKEGERVVKERAEIAALCRSLSPLSLSLTHPANPLRIFHHPVCASVCLSSITAPQLLAQFDSRQKWWASQPCRHDSARLHEQQCQAANWWALLEKLGTEKCLIATATAVYLKKNDNTRGLRMIISGFRLFFFLLDNHFVI